MTAGTIRQQIMAVLQAGEWGVRALSQQLGIAEKDVVAHLPHVQRSLAGIGHRLLIREAFCRACGFTFRGRERFTRPGRCPQCRQTHIAPPTFHIA